MFLVLGASELEYKLKYCILSPQRLSVDGFYWDLLILIICLSPQWAEHFYQSDI